MSRKSFVPTIATAVALTLLGPMQLSAQVSSESTESASRKAKSARYNGGSCYITVAAPEHECFFEQIWPRSLPVIPYKESSVVLTGRVSGIEPFLSEDRTHIYTEITVRPEQVFKGSSHSTFVVIDQIGGTVKAASGRDVHDGTRIDFLGRPRVGGRYVLFAKRVHHGKDLTLIRAYEFQDERVFKLTDDGTPGSVVLSNKPNQPDSLSSEEAFLQAVRARAAKDTGTTP